MGSKAVVSVCFFRGRTSDSVSGSEDGSSLNLLEEAVQMRSETSPTGDFN